MAPLRIRQSLAIRPARISVSFFLRSAIFPDMKHQCVMYFTMLVGLCACATTEPIRSPRYRIGIPDALTLSDMRLSLQNGVLAAGWKIGGERGASILAGVRTADFWAKVIIDYRPDAYRIRRYQTSPSLKYYQGVVSWRYNKWVLRLDRFLQQAVAQMVSVKNMSRVAHQRRPVTPPVGQLPSQQQPASPSEPSAGGMEAVPADTDTQPSAPIDSETENPELNTKSVQDSTDLSNQSEAHFQ